MIHRVFEKLDTLLGFEEAKAHCDIPCGIYDPHLAQVAALTVIRMVDLIGDLTKGQQVENIAYHNNMTRYIMVKEEHAELCKREIRVIFGDFIKKEHVDKYPELPALMHHIMQLGSKSRQTADRATALDLLKTVNRFAQIFWEIKGIQTKLVKAPYKPEEEIVYPIL